MQEIWDIVKRINLQITRIEEGEKTHVKGTENIFKKKIIEKNISQGNLR